MQFPVPRIIKPDFFDKPEGSMLQSADRSYIEAFGITLAEQYAVNLPECFMNHFNLVFDLVYVNNTLQVKLPAKENGSSTEVCADRVKVIDKMNKRWKKFGWGTWCSAIGVCEYNSRKECHHMPFINPEYQRQTSYEVSLNPNSLSAIQVRDDSTIDQFYTRLTCIWNNPVFDFDDDRKIGDKDFVKREGVLEVFHFTELLRHRFLLEETIPWCISYHPYFFDEMVWCYAAYEKDTLATKIAMPIFMDRLEEALDRIKGSPNRCASLGHRNDDLSPFVTAALNRGLAKHEFLDDDFDDDEIEEEYE